MTKNMPKSRSNKWNDKVWTLYLTSHQKKVLKMDLKVLLSLQVSSSSSRYTITSQELKSTQTMVREQIMVSRVRRLVSQGKKRLTYGLYKVQPLNLRFFFPPRTPCVLLVRWAYEASEAWSSTISTLCVPCCTPHVLFKKDKIQFF